MIYVRNISNKVIHLGEVMLLPDNKVPDEMASGEKYSDKHVIKQFLNMGLLELVDVRPVEKKMNQPEIKVEYDETIESETPVSEADVPASAPEEVKEDKAEETAKTEKRTTGRKRKTQTEG